MKCSRLAVCLAIGAMLLLLFPVYSVNAQNYVQYSVDVKSDGSAIWKISDFSDINASVDTWEGFQIKVFNLLDAASTQTHRDMTADSLQINTNTSFDSKTTEYSFVWENFSLIQGNQIVFGDVFSVNNFFAQLYGDAALQISYPSTFSVKSVTPTPYQRDDSDQMLDWARTQDLVNGKTSIILTSAPANQNSTLNGWQQYAIIGIIVAVGVGLSAVGFYRFKQRKVSKSAATVISAESSEAETEESKILKLLKSSGGGMRQSAIVEQCRFSKAKTSQLLGGLEKKGSVTRYKKGRDKIVNLTERVKSE